MEWVQGEFRDSADTVEGRLQHRHVDRPSGDVSPPSISGEDGREGEPIHAGSVTLSALEVGLIARIDLLEVQGTQATPVDYKHGPAPGPQAQPWEPERVQLCAQALILRENGFTCEQGVIYYVASRTRLAVPLTATSCNAPRNCWWTCDRCRSPGGCRPR